MKEPRNCWPGDRIRTTQAAIRAGAVKSIRRGIVLAEGRAPDCYRVQLDGTVTPHLFHKDFIEPDEPDLAGSLSGSEP